MQCLSGCHINSVSKWSNDQSGSISQIFIWIPKVSISDFNMSVFLLCLLVCVPIKFELGLPLESIRFLYVFDVQFLNNVSRVGIQSNQTHNFLPQCFCQVSLHHLNEEGQFFNEDFEVIFKCIHIWTIWNFFEAKLNLIRCHNVIDKDSDLCGVSFNPFFFLHFCVIFKGFCCNISQGLLHCLDHIVKIKLDLSN
jgi:hypothetical protein